MDVARRKVGINAMLYLRTALPEDVSPVWGHLEAAIQKQSVERPATGGANVWATLKARQESKTASTEKPNSENQ